MRLACCLFRFFPHGGLQRDLLKVVSVCLQRGHQVRIYTMRWQGPVPAGVELCTLPGRGVSNHARAADFTRRVARALRERPVDLVLGFNKMAGLDVYYAADSCYASKARTQRGRLYRLLPRYRALLAQERAVFGADGAGLILTLSARQRCLYKHYYGTADSRLVSLPPGLEADRRAPPDAPAQRGSLRRELGVDEHCRLLLFVGSGFRKKGLDRLLAGLAALPAALRRDTLLLVAGADRAGPFRRLAVRFGVGDRVRWLGGRDDVPRLLCAADGLCLPAYDENTGTVILEALVAGLPVLATANCGYADYVSRHDGGLVTPEPFRQQLFDEQLQQLLSAPERDRWRTNGLALGHEDELFSMPERVADLLERRVRERQADAGPAARQAAGP